MKKSRSLKVFSVLVIFSFLLGACAPREVILAEDDYWTIENDGHPVSVSLDPIQRCAENGETVSLDLVDDEGNPIQISMCPQPGTTVYDGMPVDVVDVAMLATLATPWPGDEEVVAVVWAGKTVIKLILVAGSAYAVAHGLAAMPAVMHAEAVYVTVSPTETVYIPQSPEHDTGHDVGNNLAQATALVEGYTVWTTAGGPQNQPDKFRCVAMMVGQAIARFIIWEKSSATIIVWHVAAPTGIDPWVTIYGPKGGGSLLNVPGDIKAGYPDAHMEMLNCEQMPPMPPLPSG